MGKNLLLINNIIVYCLSLSPTDDGELKRIFCKFTSVHGNVEIHVLFEKLNATVVLNFYEVHATLRQSPTNNNSYSIH